MVVNGLINLSKVIHRKRLLMIKQQMHMEEHGEQILVYRAT